MGLLDKLHAIASARQELLSAEVDPFNVVIEKIQSSTEATIGGRKVLLAGTNNYLGLTFDPQCIEAARELAKVAEDKGLREDYLIPTMDEWEVFPREAVAVGQKAIEQGVAQVKLTPDEAFEKAEAIIKRARAEMTARQEGGFVKLP